MKNRLFNSILLALTCSVCFTACNKDEQFVDLNANIVNYGNNDSKVYVDDAHYANWHNPDTVMINGTVYSVAIASDGQSRPYASIPGVEVNTNGFYAIYPCDRIITPNTTGTGFPSILMPQVQVYTQKDGKQIIKAPMAAYCEYNTNGTGHYLNFKNLCSLIEVNVPEGTEVAYIQVSSDKFLWGNASITGDNDNPENPVLQINQSTTGDNYSTNNHTVTLDCTTNGSNGSNTGGAAAHGKTGGPFYVVVPAGTYTNLTVDVYIFAEITGNRNVVKLYTNTANATNNIATINNNMIYKVDCLGTPTEVQPPYPGLGTGEFSVSPTKKVRFSQGNLQYLARKGMWRFAPNQWDIIGNAAGNTTESGRESQNAWIDLFGYGTSGKTVNNSNSTSTYYPYQYARYSYGPAQDISGTQFDWGVNEICNGGNQPNKWRTLTKDEWQFLIAVASGSSTLRGGKCGLASVTVGGYTYKGLVLVPDNYAGLSFTNQFYKVIDEDSWNIHSQNGCVFLPCAGRRNGLSVTQDYVSTTTNAEMDGYYWSSSSSGNNYSWFFKLTLWQNNSGGTVSCIQETTDMGLSVRLVRDVD